MMKNGWRYRPLKILDNIMKLWSLQVKSARRKRQIRRTMIDVRNLSEHTRRDIGWIDG